MKLSIVITIVVLIIQSHAWVPGTPPKEWEIAGYFKVGCPCGMISMWYGDLADIPSGYTLCNGDLDTPDLRNRFIVGAGDVYAHEEIGGADHITIAVTNLPAHKHDITAQPTSNDAHSHTTFNLGADTTGSGHQHGIPLQTTTTEPDHNHPIPAARTDTDGSHAHVMNAFIDDDAATNKITGIKAEKILDANQPLSGLTPPTGVPNKEDETATDGAHSHNIPADITGNDGNHFHTIPAGNTLTDGAHDHPVSGSIGPDPHSHTVTGITDNTGDDTQIDHLPPYYAVYYICCVRLPGSW